MESSLSLTEEMQRPSQEERRRETREKRDKTPEVKGSAVEVGVSVRGNFVFVEVEVGYATNNQPVLVEV